MSAETHKKNPEPEVLKPQTGEKDAGVSPAAKSVASRPLRRATYRPSHKATFIGLAVVVAILAINVAIVMFVMNGQSEEEDEANRTEVTLSSAELDSLGVARTPVGNEGTELVIGPDTQFNGKVTVAGDVSFAGELKINSRFSAADASLTRLQAGETSVQQLNVNGDSTASNLNLRENLTVLGLTRLQGPVTLTQLLTVNNNVNIAGNLAVGGILSARGFQASSLVSDSTLTIGGHIITRGVAPSVGAGPALGSNGTVSISGNDAAGTIAVNMGTGGGNGIVARVAFRQQYGATPRVIVTGIGRGMGNLYISRSSSGFSVGVDGSVSPGGYAIDYIVMQ